MAHYLTRKFQSYEETHLLGTVDDEITTNIEGTLLENVHVTSGGLLLVQHAESRTKHDRNTAENLLGHDVLLAKQEGRDSIHEDSMELERPSLRLSCKLKYPRSQPQTPRDAYGNVFGSRLVNFHLDVDENL